MIDMKPLPVIGIPRALLYYRSGTLWKAFFEALDVPVVFSPPTSREILDTGSSLAVDETCLSAKIFIGHVRSLLGTCDRIFVPRYSSFQRSELFCTRFEGLYDQMRNVFRADQHRFLCCNIDALNGSTEESAFAALGKELGFSSQQSRDAWRRAKKAETDERKRLCRLQEEALRAPGMKILLTGHPYILSDPYLGKPILDYLRLNGAVPIRADEADRESAKKACAHFTPTCRWVMNEELIGGTLLRKDRADGLILLSAFPCGPDSMTNELLTRRLHDIPILNLVLDAQTGTAGIETRLESFLDIIQFKQGAEQ